MGEFQQLVKVRGPLQVDMFAKSLNRKVQCLVAPFDHAEAVAIDAFTVDWNR